MQTPATSTLIKHPDVTKVYRDWLHHRVLVSVLSVLAVICIIHLFRVFAARGQLPCSISAMHKALHRIVRQRFVSHHRHSPPIALNKEDPTGDKLPIRELA
ncbi:hypothetical protein VTL71DRAFT_15086 [Oculimacula yallundae]|uniref:Uncharacterized protein n=1 Tax=Oculimacula yallundae TaxID=86028 RepID=A0ABR4CFK6_9HELO